jgi:hypothetical protein
MIISDIEWGRIHTRAILGADNVIVLVNSARRQRAKKIVRAILRNGPVKPVRKLTKPTRPYNEERMRSTP